MLPVDFHACIIEVAVGGVAGGGGGGGVELAGLCCWELGPSLQTFLQPPDSLCQGRLEKPESAVRAAAAIILAQSSLWYCFFFSLFYFVLVSIHQSCFPRPHYRQQVEPISKGGKTSWNPPDFKKLDNSAAVALHGADPSTPQGSGSPCRTENSSVATVFLHSRGKFTNTTIDMTRI